jgi:hypothetical protein
MLDGIEKTIAQTDSDGVFFTTLTSTSDGTHQIYVQEVLSERNFSETVSFSVDTTSAILEDVILYPQDAVEAGNTLTVTVLSEANLKEVRLRTDGQDHVLQEDDVKKGNYSVSFPVSLIPGEYKVDLFLTDNLDNESKFLSQLAFTVKKPPSTQPPSPIGLTTVPGKESVQLSWDAVTEHNEDIALYVIYSGNSELNLREEKSVPATQNTAVISDLEAGKEFFFTVSAVDVQGKESLQSEFVTSRPLFGDDDSSVHSASELPVEVEAGDASATVSWELSEENPDFYVIKYGVRAGEYVEQVAVSRFETSLTITDLINGIPYYFTIVAYKNRQPLSADYSEVSVTPRFSGIHPTALDPVGIDVPHQTSAGPENALIFIGISFLFCGLLFVFRPKFRLS